MNNATVNFFNCSLNYVFDVTLHSTNIGNRPWYTIHMGQSKGSNSLVTFFSEDFDSVETMPSITIKVPPGSYIEDNKLVIPTSAMKQSL